jgi:hypothetical protein
LSVLIVGCSPQNASIGPSATGAQPAYTGAAGEQPVSSNPTGPPAEFAGYEAELHAICDTDVQSVADSLANDPGTDENTQRMRNAVTTLWPSRKHFPDRWQFCREIEDYYCKGSEPNSFGQEYLKYYATLKKPNPTQTQLEAQWVKLEEESEPRQPVAKRSGSLTP